MDSFQTELDNILVDMININDNVLISNNIEDINILYNKIKTYEKELKKINNTIQIISSLKDNLKIVFNNIILKKSNKNMSTSNILKKIKTDNKIEIDKSQYIAYKNVTNSEKFKDLNCCKLPVINISNNNLDSIINAPIYYINETK